MGTLTGDAPALTEHCEHKLPTSCRLTATPTCCACQDTRPHSRHYSTYVDGIGLVDRGTRWQRYCYYCMQFWSNRIAATIPRMDPSDTRIPEEPEQQPFLNAWFDYHRGYKVEKTEDGSEQKRDIQPEKPWKDADPGTLPVLDERERRMASRGVRRERAGQTPQVSLDDTLDNLVEEAEEDEEAHLEPEGPDAELRRQEADEKAVQEASERLQEADRRHNAATLRKQRAACELQAAEGALRQSHATRRTAQREHQQAQDLYQMLHRQDQVRERAAQRMARVWGTREDMERQGAEYVSPLTSMFTRAYDRFRTAEEVRAQARESAQNSERHREYLTELAQQQYPALFYAAQDQAQREVQIPGPIRTLDDDLDERPPPMTDDQLTIKLECKVCLQQIADTACLPCGHLVMCVHCADILIPGRENDHTAPARKSQCPLCRKSVNRRVRVFTS